MKAGCAHQKRRLPNAAIRKPPHARHQRPLHIPQGMTRNTFTHHQKTVIVDAPPAKQVPRNAHPEVRSKRHVVAFVGGIDLCDGR